jgi:NADPH-dependent ferric siderophore reductase
MMGTQEAETSFRTSYNALFDGTVKETRHISPGFIRVTVSGPHLKRFAPTGRDQRIKIFLPNESGTYPGSFNQPAEPVTEAEWRAAWRSLDAQLRPVLRSYTPVAVRPAIGEVDLDVYLHGSPGPASLWALNAMPGDRIPISGPDVLSSGDALYGIQWRPGPAKRVLLAGDETAYPAIRGILDSLSPGTTGDVFVEVGEAEDLERFRSLPGGLELHAIPRCAARGGVLLCAAIDEWAASHAAPASALGDSFYAWLTTESSRVAGMRESLIRRGIPRSQVHAQGYWHDRPRRQPQ